MVFVRAGAVVAVPIRVVETKSDAATGTLTLRWEGGEPPFQVEKASAVTGPFQAVGSTQTERVFLDTAALRGGAQAFYRVRQIGP